MTAELRALQPCPFCNGIGYVGTIVYTKSPYVDDQCKDQLTYWQVNCSGCMAIVRGLAGYRTEAEAISAWNQRNNASALLDEADPAACPNCNGRLWVCENHPTQTNWEECCGVGMMCGVCCREEIIRGAVFHAERRIVELEADAERWRAFISSERFYVMGAAGFTWEPPAVDPERDKDNWLHFTLNVWDKHPAGDDAQGRHGRALLLAYVEHLRASQALSQSPSQGDAS